jgi:hypothetical protein
MLEYLIALPLTMHGLANLGGAIAPWTRDMQGFKDTPWLLSKNVTFKSPIGRAFSLLWLASTILLVAAGAGVFLQQPWWPSAAIVGCLCSFLSIVPWWKAVVPGAYFGAFFDLVVVLLLSSPVKETILTALE